MTLLKEMKFKAEFADLIQTNRKTQTTRTSKKGLSKGDEIFARTPEGYSIGILVIESIEKRKLGSLLNDEDASREGFKKPSEFQSIWHTLHPRKGWDADQDVWVFRFRFKTKIPYTEDEC